MGDVEITLYIWPTMYTTVYQRKGEKAKIDKQTNCLQSAVISSVIYQIYRFGLSLILVNSILLLLL